MYTGSYEPGTFSSISCPASRISVVPWNGLGAVSSSQPCACTSIRNDPGPNAAEASTIPLDSHEPGGNAGFCDWSTCATRSSGPDGSV